METGLYYLKSRYYDPQTGRFISMDSIDYLNPETIGGANLFAYCNCNPVKYIDPSGNFFVSIGLLIGSILVGAALGFGTNVISQVVSSGGSWNDVNWGAALESALVGGAIGFAGSVGGTILGSVLAGTAILSVAETFVWFGISVGVSFLAGTLGYAVEKSVNNEKIYWNIALKKGGLTAIVGAFAYGAGAISSLVNISGSLGNGYLNKIARNFVSDVFSQPISWLFDLIGENIK